MARSGPLHEADFHVNERSPTAVRLARLMRERGVSVNGLAAEIAGGHRRTVQRWLDGKAIIERNRQKLAAYFGVSPDDFVPPDPLSDVTPLLERVEQIRRERGMAVGTIVGVVRRLAAR